MGRTWTKRYAGFYTLDNTEYAVASTSATLDDGITDGSRVEWALIRNANPDDHNAGDTIGWYNSMRDARIAAELLA